MILSDKTIESLLLSGRLVVEGITDYDAQLQPASLDLRLGNEFKTFTNNLAPIEPGADWAKATTHVIRSREQGFTLHPKQFVLGTTQERVRLPNDIVGRVEGRSSLGRIGLMVHVTAGYIDPGFFGHITLELCNLNSVPLLIRPGHRICQLSFHQMDKSAFRPYGSENLNSKYQGQWGVTVARQDKT